MDDLRAAEAAAVQQDKDQSAINAIVARYGFIGALRMVQCNNRKCDRDIDKAFDNAVKSLSKIDPLI